MAKKFRLRSRLLLVWLLFAAAQLPVSLTPAQGFSRVAAPAAGSGGPARGGPADTIRCWEVSCLLPVYNQHYHVERSDTSAMRLYVGDDLMMYEFTGHEYYIFEKDSLSGIRYDDRFPDQPASFPVDSLRRMITPYLTHFGLFNKGIGRLVSTVSQSESGLLKETYTDVNLEKHPNADSCFVVYTDRLNFLPREMSLSYTMDSLYQKRLCNLKLVVRPRLVPNSNQVADRSEWVWALQEIRNFDRNNAQSYFSRYRHERMRKGAADTSRP